MPVKVDKYTGLHPVLVKRVKQVYAAMLVLDLPMVLTDGLRSAEQQAVLYQIGRTKPGRIVTNADGVTHKSNHQAQADGFGHACDSTFLNDAGQPFWPSDDDPVWKLRWQAFGDCALVLNLRWGGTWSDKAPHDLPHLELL